MKNDYYSIAINDLEYLVSVIPHARGYNQIAVQAQQAAEKLLKSVAEIVCTSDIEEILKTHNLKKIYTAIQRESDEFTNLNARDLAYLKDYYFEAKYPGDDFITVTLEQCNECLEIMYEVFNVVNQFRVHYSLEIKTLRKQVLCTKDVKAVSAFD